MPGVQKLLSQLSEETALSGNLERKVRAGFVLSTGRPEDDKPIDLQQVLLCVHGIEKLIKGYNASMGLSGGDWMEEDIGKLKDAVLTIISRKKGEDLNPIQEAWVRAIVLHPDRNPLSALAETLRARAVDAQLTSEMGNGIQTYGEQLREESTKTIVGDVRKHLDDRPDDVEQYEAMAEARAKASIHIIEHAPENYGLLADCLDKQAAAFAGFCEKVATHLQERRKAPPEIE